MSIQDINTNQDKNRLNQIRQEDCWSEEYKNELKNVHAPAELIARTKLAMKEETDKNKNVKKIKIIPVTRYLAVAAAVILVVGGMLFAGKMGTHKQENPTIHLATDAGASLELIEKDDGNFKVSKTEKNKDEIFGKDAFEREIGGVTVTFSVNEISGHPQGFMQVNGENYLMNIRQGEMQDLIELVTEYLER